ncbi:YraN family protein [uncultured Anaerotruncus sp.]|uniref:YraN family protein n=1 Tax=uncultured Anaerotruncus sp. TaxID=905011 RepID=UPI00280A7D29|nr:YraN family protein [uncultured Anaerotruncus sp.]
MTATTRRRGTLGEEFAAKKLAEAGYEILARNWRSGRNEIDLILQKGGVIAFVEVKTRAQNALAAPAASVAKAQRRRIALAAVAYLRERGIYNTGAVQPRFDLFEVVTERPGSNVVTRWAHLAGAYDTGDLDVFI